MKAFGECTVCASRTLKILQISGNLDPQTQCLTSVADKIYETIVCGVAVEGSSIPLPYT